MSSLLHRQTPATSSLFDQKLDVMKILPLWNNKAEQAQYSGDIVPDMQEGQLI